MVIKSCCVQKCHWETKRICLDCESNTGPQDLQSCALPTELSRLYVTLRQLVYCKNIVLSFTVIEQRIVRVFQICVRAFKAIER